MKPLNNYIHCNLYRDNRKLTTKSGIMISPYVYEGNEAMHVNRVFKVVTVPDKFKYYEDKLKKDNQCKNFSSPEWNTDIECVPGDIVFTSKSGGLNAHYVGSDDVLINYTHIYFLLRKGNDIKIGDDNYDIIPINGYVICEPYREKVSFLWTPDDDKPIEWGKTLYVGKRNKEYWNVNIYDKKSHRGFDALEINKGDIIRKRRADIHFDIENDLYSMVNSKWFVIHRRDIIGIKTN